MWSNKYYCLLKKKMHSTSYVLFSHVIHLFIHLSLFEILTPPKKKKKPHHHLKLPPHNPSPP